MKLKTLDLYSIRYYRFYNNNIPYWETY